MIAPIANGRLTPPPAPRGRACKNLAQSKARWGLFSQKYAPGRTRWCLPARGPHRQGSARRHPRHNRGMPAQTRAGSCAKALGEFALGGEDLVLDQKPARARGRLPDRPAGVAQGDDFLLGFLGAHVLILPRRRRGGERESLGRLGPAPLNGRRRPNQRFADVAASSGGTAGAGFSMVAHKEFTRSGLINTQTCVVRVAP